jgi:hypothetical protein
MNNQSHRIGYRTLSDIYANVGGCGFFIGEIDTRETVSRLSAIGGTQRTSR